MSKVKLDGEFMSVTRIFMQKLKGGGFSSLPGARRAIAKYRDITEQERDTLRQLADSYFQKKNVSSTYETPIGQLVTKLEREILGNRKRIPTTQMN